MRQIKNADQRLQKDDYAFIKFPALGVTILALIYDENDWAFYAKSDIDLCGSCIPLDEDVQIEYPVLNRYESSWILHADEYDTLRMGLDYLTSDCDAVCQSAWEIMTGDLDVYGNPTNNSEDNNTTRQQEIMEFINKNYTEECMYSGIHDYHAHQGRRMNLPKHKYTYRMGVELEVEFNNDRLLDEFTDKPSNWFFCEHDGSLGLNGCEIITIPMRPQDAKDVQQWKILTDYLDGKATSWDTGRCGLHVHIGREILGKSEEQRSETIGKLLYLYHHFVKDTRLNIAVYGRDVAYNDRDGKTDVGNSAKTLGGEVFKSKDICNKVKDAMVAKSSHARYFDVNLQNDNTIEFRKGKGSLRPERITMVVEYSEKLCLYAKHTPWVQISYDDFVKYLKSTDCSVSLKDMIETRA